ncbi:fasciclin-like arabinogalactan protein 21 [Nicotiana tabacum]|uniref:Fasciclin-like arabinogalactan protein 21 n=1 Tax=Nicotiana tabacum TaxID=4097 RepID=A0A1S3ZB07_TOBAC|nr:PREDICTED: fasciclin-like arabinogalactan protein 21 [Nicotiana tabacum]
MAITQNLLLILISLFISAASATFPDSIPPLTPSPMISPHDHTSLFATVLSSLGFQQLSTAATAANLTTTTTPITVFAPADSSLITCPTCSLPLLLQEHSVPGLYPLHFLRTLAFGTKLETLAPNRCLTVTFSTTTRDAKIFINGVEVTQPDLFNNGLILVHGLRGFVSHLSPLSCNVERMSSLSFDSFPIPNSVSTVSSASPFSIMRFMLKDAIIRLRNSGYSIVALALRVKYAELSELKAMTVFALDDVSIFASGGHAYLSNFRFHVVPNRRIMAGEMVSLPAGTVLLTLDGEEKLVVTTAGGGGVLAPMKVNYVRIVSFDLLHNSRIVVHGVSVPFPHMHHHTADQKAFAQMEQSRTHCDVTGNGGVCDVIHDDFAPAGMRSVMGNNMEEHEGL